MRNRAAALAGRGGRRGCADGDMVAVVQRGAGVSVKSPLLHWLEHLWAQGGREAEDATRRGITPEYSVWRHGVMPHLRSCVSLLAPRRPIKAQPAGSHYEYCLVKLFERHFCT